VDPGCDRIPTEVHVGETSWAFLIVGTFAAVGAAMAVGTLAALVRYHRTGSFPGSDEVGVLPRGRLLSLWARVAIGVVLTIVGIVAIDRAGIF
jgi:hypothetical protein